MKDIVTPIVCGLLCWLMWACFDRVAVLASRVEMVIMVQQSQQLTINELEAMNQE